MTTDAERKAGNAASAARRAIETRDLWIRKAHKEGSTLRAIAAATGLSHGGVKKILER